MFQFFNVLLLLRKGEIKLIFILCKVTKLRAILGGQIKIYTFVVILNSQYENTIN